MATAIPTTNQLVIALDSSIPAQRQSQASIGRVPVEVLKIILTRVSSHPPSLASCARACRKFYCFAMPLLNNVRRPDVSRIFNESMRRIEINWPTIEKCKKELCSTLSASPETKFLDEIARRVEVLVKDVENIDSDFRQSVARCTIPFFYTSEFRQRFRCLLIQLSLQQLQLTRLQVLSTSVDYRDALKLRGAFLRCAYGRDRSAPELDRLNAQIHEHKMRCPPFIQATVTDLFEDCVGVSEKDEEVAKSQELITRRYAPIVLREEFTFGQRRGGLALGLSWLDISNASTRKLIADLETIAKGFQEIHYGLQPQTHEGAPPSAELAAVQELNGLLRYYIRHLSPRNEPDEIRYCRRLLERGKSLEDHCKLLGDLKNYKGLERIFSCEKEVFAYWRHFQLKLPPSPDCEQRAQELLQNAIKSFEALETIAPEGQSKTIRRHFDTYIATLRCIMDKHAKFNAVPPAQHLFLMETT